MQAAAQEPDLATNDLGPLAWVLEELRKSLESASSALRRFVRDGGKVAQFGIDSLRRQVRVTRTHIVEPTAPARTDVPNDAFDDCGKKAMADLAEADKNGKLFGSMAHGHANPAAVKNAMYDVITRHFNGELDSQAAAEELANAVAAAQ